VSAEVNMQPVAAYRSLLQDAERLTLEEMAPLLERQQVLLLQVVASGPSLETLRELRALLDRMQQRIEAERTQIAVAAQYE
jgi:hypothetical protein